MRARERVVIRIITILSSWSFARVQWDETRGDFAADPGRIARLSKIYCPRSVYSTYRYDRAASLAKGNLSAFAGRQ